MSLFFKRSAAAPRTILNNPPSAEATRISSVSFTVEALSIGSQPKVENIGTAKDVNLKISVPVATTGAIIDIINQTGIAGQEF